MLRRSNFSKDVINEINHGDHPILKAMNFKKIKYSVLDKLLEKQIPDNVDTVNFIINLHGLFSSLYMPEMINTFNTINKEEKYMISSQVINTIAHFRHYFASRQGLYSNFYFYYSYEECKENQAILPEYMQDFYNKRYDKSVEFSVINKIIHQNVNICEIIVKYIPHAYFINTHEKDFNIVPYHIIKNQKPNEFSIIYSNDDISLQHLLYDKSSLVITMNSDGSKLVNYHNIYEHLTRNPNLEHKISELLLPWFFVMTGFKKYNVKGMPLWGYRRTIDSFYKAILAKNIYEIDYQDPQQFLDDINKCDKISHRDKLPNVVLKNYEVLNPKRQYDKLSDIDISRIFDCVDLMDKKSIIAINNQYYTKYPIHLDELMEGEEYY